MPIIPKADAMAEGAVDLNFVYRPIVNPVFSMVGNVAGHTEATSQVDQGVGTAIAHAGKGAVGTSGAQVELAAPFVAAWLVANVDLQAGDVTDGLDPATDEEEIEFAGSGSATAINPAVLSAQDFTPDPAMTAYTQFGTFMAAMGSSSQVNAQVTSQASVTSDDFRGLDNFDRVTASAVGFAIASGADEHDTAATVDGVTLYDLGTEFAFVGQGSFVGTDEPNDGPAGDNTGPVDQNVLVNASAEVLNVYGRASTPDLFGALDDGDSSASVTPILDDTDQVIAYQRANEAGADLITGANEVSGVSHNAFNEGLTIDANSPWWNLFTSSADPTTTLGPYDNWTNAFLGGGGD